MVNKIAWCVMIFVALCIFEVVYKFEREKYDTGVNLFSAFVLTAIYLWALSEVSGDM